MIKGLKQCIPLKFLLFLGVIFTGVSANAQQDANLLIQKVGAKIKLVNNYVADGKMKTNVAFLDAHIELEKAEAGSLDLRLPGETIGRLRAAIVVP